MCFRDYRSYISKPYIQSRTQILNATFELAFRYRTIPRCFSRTYANEDMSSKALCKSMRYMHYNHCNIIGKHSSLLHKARSTYATVLYNIAKGETRSTLFQAHRTCDVLIRPRKSRTAFTIRCNGRSWTQGGEVRVSETRLCRMQGPSQFGRCVSTGLDPTNLFHHQLTERATHGIPPTN